MTKKQKKNQETTEKKTTGDIEPTEEKISIEEEEVELESEKPEKKQEVSTKNEKKKKESLMFGDMIGETIRLLINQTYLRESENKITSEEIKETQFGESMAKTMDFYFPSWNFEHPLFGLAASSGMLLVLINKKAPPQLYDEKTDVEGEGQGVSERDGDDQDLSPTNPYVDLPKK